MKQKGLKMVHVLLYAGCLAVLTNCDNTPKCRYGVPKALLPDKMEGMVKHDAKMEGQNGLERAKFSDGSALEILQSGCDELHQEFRFLSPAPFPDSMGLGSLAATQFYTLARRDERLAAFEQWAQLFQSVDSMAMPGQVLQVEKGMAVKLDKINPQMMVVELIGSSQFQ
jgi:hypothetical protein